MSRRSPHDSSRTRPTGWSRRDALRPLASAALLPLLGGGALAQVYPARQISMVFPAAAASPSDLVGRHLAKAMAAQTTVPIVADNRPGANGLIGVQAVQNAPADEHTLLFTTMSTMAVNKALIKALPYEPLKDFVPLGVMYRTWLYVCVNAKLPFKSMAELVAHAKQNPGKLNFGYGTSIPQMAGKLLEARAGIEFNMIAFKQHTTMIQSLGTGEVDVTITDPPSSSAVVQGGQARMLAATSPTRMTRFADVPTLAEAGVPNYELGSAHICMVRAGTPPDVIAKLTDWMSTASRSAELQAFLTANNLDNFFVAGAEATAYVTKEIEQWGNIARTAGLSPT